MKKSIYLLIALPLLFASCQNDEQAISEESVQVSFTAGIPQQMETRASATLSVDKLYCAVFENGEEIENLRGEIDITDSQNLVFAPRLIKGRTYEIAFWASKEGSYNIDDMTAITRNTNVAEEDFDAFTAHTSITVEGNASQNVTLHRPLALLNLGVTPEDWDGVANPNTFGMTPTIIQVILNGKNAFNAVTGKATGNVKALPYNLNVSGNEFTVTFPKGDGTSENKTFKSLAMCYVLMEETQQNNKSTSTITFKVYDQSQQVIRENAQILNVPLQANYKTHVVGGLLTGTVTCNIAFGDIELETDNEHNKEIK